MNNEARNAALALKDYIEGGAPSPDRVTGLTDELILALGGKTQSRTLKNPAAYFLALIVADLQ